MIGMTTDIVSCPDDGLIQDDDERPNQHPVDDDPGVPAVAGGSVGPDVVGCDLPGSDGVVDQKNPADQLGTCRAHPGRPRSFCCGHCFCARTMSSPGAG